MLVRHTVGMPELTEMIDGLHVTSLARTVVDIASARSFTHAVTMADAALRRSLHPLRGVPPTALSRELLAEELDRLPLRHGSVKARRVVEFADGLADRPGESVSRVNMHRAALSAPQLQVVLTGRSGRRYVVDFWWPQFNVIGEFDGRAKYTDPEFLRGRTPEQALLDEKSREDDLRAAGHSVSRWGWDVAINPRLLRAHLVAAGVR